MTKPVGLCYRDAWRYQLKNGGILVHGSVLAGNKRIKHAWVEIGDEIYEPQNNELWPKKIFYDVADPIVNHTYGIEESIERIALEKAHGPWDDPEFIRMKQNGTYD